MREASESPFAQRMMEKPIPDSLNVDANARHFFDPPELIQRAFGGRDWFIATGCGRAHRIGLFKGLGWFLDPVFARQDERGINGVRIVYTGKDYTIEFVRREYGEDHSFPVTTKIVDYRAGVRLEDLKGVYASVLGEHVV